MCGAERRGAAGVTGEATLEGHGLHSGRPASVTLTRRRGPLVFRTDRGEAMLSDLQFVRTDRGVRVEATRIGLDVDGVEHLLAALGGLGIRDHLAITVRGGEVPLCDGAAAEFAQALLALELPTGRPSSIVTRQGEVRVDGSTYRFQPADAPALRVDVHFAAPRIGHQTASWDGSADDFLENVAWARTFGFVEEAEQLAATGRARGARPGCVLVLDGDGDPIAPGRPPRPGEFARHKLLDLIGDSYLWGGPPVGLVHATRPGHTATRRALEEALTSGLLRPITREQ